MKLRDKTLIALSLIGIHLMAQDSGWTPQIPPSVCGNIKDIHIQPGFDL